MRFKRDKHIDDLLRQWADNRSAKPNDLDILHEQILKRLPEQSEIAHPSQLRDSLSILPSKPKWPYVGAGLAAAASLLLAVSIFWQPKTFDTSVEATSPDHRPFSREHELEIASLYKELFGPRLSWVLKYNGHGDIGLTDTNLDKSAGTKQYAAIRLVLWSRVAKNGHWIEVQSLDLLVEGERQIEIPATNTGTGLAIWAYPLDRNLIAIDLSFRSKVFEDHVVEGSYLQRSGEISYIFDYEQDGVEYRLYQTAEMLDELS